MTIAEREKILLDAAIEQKVKASKWEPKSKPFNALQELRDLVAADTVAQVDEMMTKPTDGRSRTMVICKNCGRRVKSIDGRIISHTRIKGDYDNWCKYDNDP